MPEIKYIQNLVKYKRITGINVKTPYYCYLHGRLTPTIP
jgi:hypothetical protein